MDASLDTIVEVREEEIMVSSSSGVNPTCRIAYFLKPTCIKESSASDILPPHSMTASSNLEKLPLEVRYNGWLHPHEEWKKWVQQMQPKYEYLWIKAGVEQAIKASTYQIHRNDELILGLSQRWCSKTNTFIFPWGEATITLEDIKICGGYSILGDPFFSPLETQEEKEKEAELIAVRREFFKSKAKRADHKPWMMHFMRNKSQVEHEAFLCVWLSRFVFPANSLNSILKSVFPIAIHLARGTRIALAPAVLASIYRDLTLLNNNVGIATINLLVTIWAPFQLVQIWALERFQSLQPQTPAIEHGEPRMARWGGVKLPKIENFELALDYVGTRNCFVWRPYKNSPPLRLYNENDMWECDNPCRESELQSFTRCLRVCELVGVGCIEHYFPHRVAMQFGMDQDIPGVIAPCHEDPWVNYSQLVLDRNLCKELCPCPCQPNVTLRYYAWWRQSKVGKEVDRRMDTDNGVICITSSEDLSQDSSGQVEDDGSNRPRPRFLSKRTRDEVGDSDQRDELANAKPSSSFKKYRCFEDEMIRNSATSIDVFSGSKRTIEDVKMEDVGGNLSAKEDANEAKPKYQVGNFDQEDKLLFNEVSSSSSVKGRPLSSPQYDVLPSTPMTSGVHNFTKGKDVLRGSKRTMESGQTEDIIGGARKDTDDGNESRRKSPFCHTNVVNKKGEGASPCAIHKVSESDLENRIHKLRRTVDKLKAARFGHNYENVGAKPNL